MDEKKTCEFLLQLITVFREISPCLPSIISLCVCVCEQQHQQQEHNYCDYRVRSPHV